MSAKRYKLPESAFSEQVRRARKALRTMSPQERIDLMVKAGVMTPQQADKAKANIAVAGG